MDGTSKKYTSKKYTSTPKPIGWALTDILSATNDDCYGAIIDLPCSSSVISGQLPWPQTVSKKWDWSSFGKIVKQLAK